MNNQKQAKRRRLSGNQNPDTGASNTTAPLKSSSLIRQALASAAKPDPAYKHPLPQEKQPILIQASIAPSTNADGKWFPFYVLSVHIKIGSATIPTVPMYLPVINDPEKVTPAMLAFIQLLNGERPNLQGITFQEADVSFFNKKLNTLSTNKKLDFTVVSGNPVIDVFARAESGKFSIDPSIMHTEFNPLFEDNPPIGYKVAVESYEGTEITEDSCFSHVFTLFILRGKDGKWHATTFGVGRTGNHSKDLSIPENLLNNDVNIPTQEKEKDNENEKKKKFDDAVNPDRLLFYKLRVAHNECYRFYGENHQNRILAIDGVTNSDFAILEEFTKQMIAFLPVLNNTIFDPNTLNYN